MTSSSRSANPTSAPGWPGSFHVTGESCRDRPLSALTVEARSNSQAAQALAAEITSAGGTALAIGAGLRRREAPGQLVQAAADALGPVDVLVSNAGLSRVQPLEDLTAAQFDEILAVNLRAPFLLAQCAVPSMRDRAFGRILFISSVAAFTG